MIGQRRRLNIFVKVMKEKKIYQLFLTANKRKIFRDVISIRVSFFFRFTPADGNTCKWLWYLVHRLERWLFLCEKQWWRHSG